MISMSLIVDIEKKLDTFELRSVFETGNGKMALLGASGCGKSVTLKCIAGIMSPDEGQIILDGETLFDSAKRIDLAPQKRNVGYLFQQYALFPNMDVTQNIMCGVRTKSKDEKRAKAQECIRRFQLEGMEKKYPAQLSGGQQQRVALARIIASEPKAILLDEPFSALDSYLKWNLELELSDMLSFFEGPMIWVSHDLGECYRNCDSVCVMEQGKTGPVTSMDELLSHPDTPGAARLIGFRNFLPAHKSGEDIIIDNWDIIIRRLGCGDITMTAIADDGVDFNGKTYAAKVEKIVTDIDKKVALLRSENSQSPIIRAVVPESFELAGDMIVSFDLIPEKCLFY